MPEDTYSRQCKAFNAATIASAQLRADQARLDALITTLENAVCRRPTAADSGVVLYLRGPAWEQIIRAKTPPEEEHGLQEGQG